MQVENVFRTNTPSTAEGEMASNIAHVKDIDEELFEAGSLALEGLIAISSNAIISLTVL